MARGVRAGKASGAGDTKLGEEYDVLLGKYRTLKTRAAAQEKAAEERYAALERLVHERLTLAGA